jgi:hypothetical protein
MHAYMHVCIICMYPLKDCYQLELTPAFIRRYIEYAMQPPWVRISPKDPYIQSHLEEICPKLPSENSKQYKQDPYR